MQELKLGLGPGLHLSLSMNKDRGGKIKVVVADDHSLVRTGMLRLLSTFPRIGEVKEVANGKELVDLCRVFAPDVALVDIEMPVIDGFGASEILLDRFQEVKILILTMHAGEEYIERFLSLGVHGFLSKNTNQDELERAIYAVVDNDFYHNEATSAVIRKLMSRRGRDLPKRAELSPREIEVLCLICQEVTCKEISDRLFISEKTVHNHRTRIMEKIKAKSTIGLIRYAYKHGYINWDNNL